MTSTNFHGPLAVGAASIPYYSQTVQLAARFTTTPGGLTPGVTGFMDTIRGVVILPWTRVMSIAPKPASTTTVATSQSVNAGAAAVLTAGTGVTKTTRGTTTVYRLDTPRCLVITSAGNDSSNTITVSGFDEYGSAMTSTLVGGNTAAVTTGKAFLDVASVVVSTTTAAAISIGVSNVFGLPLYAYEADQVLVWLDGTMQNTPGNFTAGDTTAPATGATTDVRGTYSMAGTDGTKIISIDMLNPNLSAPNTVSSARTMVPSTLILGQPQV